jgi:hypothetical protein
MRHECVREEDVLEAVTTSGWPARADDNLRAHVASCAVCADLVEVTTALLEDRELACSEATLPPSGVVWWRAQLRAREDAARAAARPLAFIQGVAASVALWLVVTLLRAIPAADVVNAWGWARRSIGALSIPWPDLTNVVPAAGWATVGLVCLLAAWLMLAPIAIYLAVGDE